jgi:hypothetical protein
MSLTELALLDGRRHLPLGDVIGLILTLTLTVNIVKCASNNHRLSLMCQR